MTTFNFVCLLTGGPLFQIGPVKMSHLSLYKYGTERTVCLYPRDGPYRHRNKRPRVKRDVL